MLNFDLLKKALQLVSPPLFVYDFSKKLFLKFHCLVVFLRYREICVAIACFPNHDVIYFEINLSNQAVFLHHQKIQSKI